MAYKIEVRFPTKDHAMMFASWLCGSGEQDFFTWQDCSSEDPKNPIVRFSYHKENKRLARDDPKRYGPFMAERRIVAELE